MNVVGREVERKILVELLDKQESQFVAMYGRRRIGKTFLIRQTYEKHLVFDCAGLYQSNREQLLENFWLKISAKFNKVVLPPKSWLQAFKILEDYLETLPKKGKKKVIFLDEISWFDTPKGGFLGALSNFWNSYCTKREDVVLIICGSAASWIIEKVVKSKGGLHNRLNRTIRLNPFTLEETQLYFKEKKMKFSIKDTIQLYMCLGGIPFYLNAITPGKSVPQILDELCFEPDALLSNEFEKLYAALFKNHENHVKVIKALANKNKGLTRNEIVKFTSQSTGGGLTKVLEELEECDFISKYRDFDKAKEDGLYRLTDEYSIFYLKFMQDKKKFLKGNDLTSSQSFKTWSGFAFENLCFKHLTKIASSLGISGIGYEAFSFIDKGGKDKTGTQIDLIIDRADNAVNIIEIKYYNELYRLTKNDAANITQKVNSFTNKTNTKKTIFVTLISPHGAIKNEHYLSVISNELLAKDLMAK